MQFPSDRLKLAHEKTEGFVAKALHNLVSKVPGSTEQPGPDAAGRAQRIVSRAALKAGAISGAAALPLGPMGLATIFPDLLGIWRLQQQLVADVAAVFGHSRSLTPETMVVCLFQHTDPSIARNLTGRRGGSVLIRKVAEQTLKLLLEKVAIRIGQRLVGKAAARWLPVVGALGVGAHAYVDTTKVGANAIGLFSSGLELDVAPTPDPVPTKAASATAKAAAKPSPRKKRAPRAKSRRPSHATAGGASARSKRAA